MMAALASTIKAMQEHQSAATQAIVSLTKFNQKTSKDRGEAQYNWIFTYTATDLLKLLRALLVEHSEGISQRVFTQITSMQTPAFLLHTPLRVRPPSRGTPPRPLRLSSHPWSSTSRYRPVTFVAGCAWASYACGAARSLRLGFLCLCVAPGLLCL